MYVVTPHRLRVDPARFDAVTAIIITTNKSQLKLFLGLKSYYRCFVSSYAARIERLLRLLPDMVPFQWTDDQNIFSMNSNI